jgi:hypothetical protein
MNTLAYPHYFGAWHALMNSPIAPYLPEILVVLIVWELIWKGTALWYAARNRQQAWYVFILILNTVGILSILYIAFFRKNKNNVVHTTTVTHTISASSPGMPGSSAPDSPTPSVVDTTTTYVPPTNPQA